MLQDHIHQNIVATHLLTKYYLQKIHQILKNQHYLKNFDHLNRLGFLLMMVPLGTRFGRARDLTFGLGGGFGFGLVEVEWGLFDLELDLDHLSLDLNLIDLNLQNWTSDLFHHLMIDLIKKDGNRTWIYNVRPQT